jgi:hypothetical protein
MMLQEDTGREEPCSANAIAYRLTPLPDTAAASAEPFNWEALKKGDVLRSKRIPDWTYIVDGFDDVDGKPGVVLRRKHDNEQAAMWLTDAKEKLEPVLSVA